MEKKKWKVNIHLVAALLILVALIIIVRKITGFFRYITQEEIDAISVPENAVVKTYDLIIPLEVEDTSTFPEDDGVMTVLCLGNSPFADEKDSPENPCGLFAEATGATVYNCAVPGSYMAASNPDFDSSYPMDAFSFYWLTSMFVLRNQPVIDAVYAGADSLPPEAKASLDTLLGLDLRAIDVIYVMYDCSDYLEAHEVLNAEIPTDPQCFSGSLAAGIAILQEYCPWIRIVVMSPAYAYGTDENGGRISSDSKIFGGKKLSNYVQEEYYTAEAWQVSFVDCFYGGIHEDVADKYLADNTHLNAEGKALIAARMEEALQPSLPKQDK